MTDWRTRLRDEIDPASAERLTPEAARAMRRAVVAVARAHAREDASFPLKRALALAATVVLMIAAGISAGRRTDPAVLERPAPARSIPSAPARDARPAANRQLQFSTPGGTRIIWIFNSDLNLKATNP
jgi:hypothetical protein